MQLTIRPVLAPRHGPDPRPRRPALPASPPRVRGLLPRTLLAAAILVATPAVWADAFSAHGRCSSCHIDRGASGPITADRPAVSANRSCGTCHAEARIEAPAAVRTGRPPSGHAVCTSCHAAHDNGRPYQLRAAPVGRAHGATVLDEVTRLCVSCHAETAQTRGAQGHFVRHPVGRTLGARARSEAARLGLPLADVAGNADPADDVISCLTCHDVHSGAGAHRLRWDSDSEPEACRGCHALDDPPALLLVQSRR